MKQKIKSALQFLRVLYLVLFASAQERVFHQWKKADGDNILRLKYPLDKKSLVFDLGGYEGQWSSDIFSKYLCSIHVFEPVPSFCKKIKTRFSKNSFITVRGFGLAEESRTDSISLDENESSIIKRSARSQKIRLVRASDYIQKHKITKIDLMKINIEGAEYELLEHLIETNAIKIIDQLQIQFHAFVPNSKEKRNKLQNKLKETHHLTYEYPFIWENWKKGTSKK